MEAAKDNNDSESSGSSVIVVEKEPASERGFVDEGAKVVYELIKHGAIVLDKSKDDSIPFRYNVDFRKAESILGGLQGKRDVQSLTERHSDLLFHSQLAFRKMVKSFVNEGVLDDKISIQTGRIIRPSRINILKEGHCRFLYMKDVFPKDRDDMAVLYISEGQFNEYYEFLESEVKKAKLNLSEESMFRITLRRLIAHEYGHAVDRTISILLASKNSDEENIEDEFEVSEKLHLKVYKEIAPDKRLNDILEEGPEDRVYSKKQRSSSERIARGFEYIALNSALIDEGVDLDKSDLIVKKIVEKQGERLSDFIFVLRYAKSKGLDIENVCGALNELVIGFRNKSIGELLPSGFSSHYLGYFCALSKEQIIKYVELSRGALPKIKGSDE